MALFRSKSIIGLDIGSSCVKAVELTGSPSAYRLVGYGYAPLPPEAIVQGSFMNAPEIGNAVREAYAQLRTRTTHVAASVSGHSVIVKRISLPAQSEQELEETIGWEAEQYIPFDINEVNVDHQILRSDEASGQIDVLLVAAKKDLIDDYRSVISDAGLTLSVVDVDAFAVGNMYEHCYEPDDDSVTALVDIGASVININVMQGRVPAFTRDITTGGNQYTEQIQKTLGISFEEAERIKIGGRPGEVSKEVVPQEVQDAIREVSDQLLGEIHRSLDFYRATGGNARLERVVLCGGAASIPGLDRLVAEKLELAVELADPFRRIEIASSAGDEPLIRDMGPALCVALGLAMRREDLR
jgi:type IV pilus assembly protein PilM